MFSKILIKLIDQAIVPAILLLTVRLVSIVLISYYLEIPFSTGNGGIVFENSADFVLANSYSMVALLISLSLGITYTLVKTLAFHNTHITPALTAKVFSLRLNSLIQGSFDLYPQGAIWLSYLYLLLLVGGVMAMFGLLFSWIFYLMLTVTLIATVIFIWDIEREIKISKMQEDDFGYIEDEDETIVLDFGDDNV